jgi:CheY-like chemotaxis protein
MKDILVVDDDVTMLEVIKRILERGGITAHCVTSGAAALEKLRERSFPLMITDLNMPGLNGLELSRKGLELAPAMRIIMDTSGISPTNERLAHEIGISRILTKPFKPNEMLETIGDVMYDKVSPCI